MLNVLCICIISLKKKMLEIFHLISSKSNQIQIIFENSFWLFVCISHSRIFHSYGDTTITGEGAASVDLWSAHRTIDQLGFFSVPHILHLHKSRYCDIVPLHKSRNLKVRIEDARDERLLMLPTIQNDLFNQECFHFPFQRRTCFVYAMR